MSPSFDPNKDIPILTDKVYIVTGGSAGIGFGIVAHLLQHSPAKIYLLSNKEEHAEEAQQELKKWGDVEKIVEWVKCDLADLKMVDAVAERLSAEKRIDGVGFSTYSTAKLRGIYVLTCNTVDPQRGPRRRPLRRNEGRDRQPHASQRNIATTPTHVPPPRPPRHLEQSRSSTVVGATSSDDERHALQGPSGDQH